jgi:hypothetical protein
MNYRALLIPLLALSLVGFAKKEPKATVRFHTQANSADTAAFSVKVNLQDPPREVFIQKIPFISENDVAAIYPFAAPDGTLGCAFKLDQHGTLELDTQSIMRKGSVIVAFVNGRQICDLLIDKRVSDGVLFIPRGLNAQEIASLQKRFPTLGATKDKKKRKE